MKETIDLFEGRRNEGADVVGTLPIAISLRVLGDESAYAKTCRDCGAKCCKLGGADVTAEERERVLEAGNPDKFRKLGENHYEMIPVGTTCPYLNADNQCSIYDVRPYACRAFPVHPEIREGAKKYLLAGCPLSNLLSKKEIDTLSMHARKINDEVTSNRFSRTQLSPKQMTDIVHSFSEFQHSEMS